MRFKSRFNKFSEFGEPKYKNGSSVGQFTVISYMGHSDVNKRNAHIMAKPQHWYRCRCSCGTEESRSQQELNDKRRQQACYKCREPSPADKQAEADYRADIQEAAQATNPNNEEQQYEGDPGET